MSTMDVNYNAVTAYERSKIPESAAPKSRVSTAILLAVFFIVMMVGLVAGAKMYASVAGMQMEASTARMQSGLLASYVRANDAADSYSAGEGPEGRSLVLTEWAEDGSVYEMRIYLYQGSIVQEYSLADAAYAPTRAQKLIDSTTFDFELHDDLLVMHTDHGVTNVAFRSYQGGAS